MAGPEQNASSEQLALGDDSHAQGLSVYKRRRARKSARSSLPNGVAKLAGTFHKALPRNDLSPIVLGHNGHKTWGIMGIRQRGDQTAD